MRIRLLYAGNIQLVSDEGEMNELDGLGIAEIELSVLLEPVVDIDDKLGT